MWNDTELPLAVLFTFRCYGTWLHGDTRGSVDRAHNIYGMPFLAESSNWQDHQKKQMLRQELTLDTRMRQAAVAGVREVCARREWLMLAVNARTNHIHSVIDVKGYDTKRALAALKAGATKRFREERLWDSEETPWAEKGSRRKLWNERSVEQAIDYVLHGQGDDLPDFDQ
ncbi:MAG TPA: transposase [Pyrinomonadaceae bacterium]|jgi:REP element-mobilizing transposase RayT|nr:transposase [Pyrinomonadaceae bacterium]